MQQHLAHLFPTREGLALAGVILAKRNPNGTFNIRGHEKEIHAQLQAAYGKAVMPQAMRYIERGCKLLAKVSDKELEQAAYPFHPNPHAVPTSGNSFSDLTKGLTMFALTSLNDMENIAQGKERLLKMQNSIHHDSLLKSYGLPTWAQLAKDDGDDEDDDEEEDEDEDDGSDDSGTSAGGGNSRYNPDEPRIPAGQPGGGQWTTGGNGVASDSGSISADDVRTALRDDFDNYDPSALPLGTQVAANDAVQSDASPQDGTTSHVLDKPSDYENKSYPNAKGNTECVAFAQQVGGAPLTRDWKAGDYISPSNPPPVGTWVATFDEDGNYYGHVGAFSHFDDDGTLYLYDQFNKKGKVTEQPYRPKPEDYSGKISNDPSQYRIVKW